MHPDNDKKENGMRVVLIVSIVFGVLLAGCGYTEEDAVKEILAVPVVSNEDQQKALYDAVEEKCKKNNIDYVKALDKALRILKSQEKTEE